MDNGLVGSGGREPRGRCSMGRMGMVGLLGRMGWQGGKGGLEGKCGKSGIGRISDGLVSRGRDRLGKNWLTR